jgi:hypothetical protein
MTNKTTTRIAAPKTAGDHLILVDGYDRQSDGVISQLANETGIRLTLDPWGT